MHELIKHSVHACTVHIGQYQTKAMPESVVFGAGS